MPQQYVNKALNIQRGLNGDRGFPNKVSFLRGVLFISDGSDYVELGS